MAKQKKEPPNPKITEAIDNMLADVKLGVVPPDTSVKIVNTAIAWERVKHNISGTDEFDPEDI